MPVFTKSKERILFVHIPKTGGSSIEQYFRYHGWVETHRKGGGVKAIHATWREYEKWGDFDYRFTVIRDPLERFRSSILHLSEDISAQLKIFRYFGTGPNWDINEQRLEEFIGIINKKPEWLGNHVRPQSDFLKTNEKVKIFRYPESMTEIPLVLNAMFDVPISRSGHGIQHLKKSIPESKPVFTKAQEEIIKQYYKKDYKRFF